MAGAALILAAGGVARGQSVRGTVSRGGLRVEGALVLLVDSTQHVVARSVTREDGSYALSAPRTGRYAVRVLRIGWAPTTAGPVLLGDGAPAGLDLSLTGLPVRIAALRIEDRAPCQVRPDSDAVAFRLWDEARKALLTASLTEHERFTMRTTSSWRTLDATGERVLADSSQVRTVPTVKPFASLPADSLAAAGYVQRNALGELLFWAPDAEVLLSESFASSHCLRAERAPADTGPMARWVGIAFQPSGAARGVADVAGVLWMDRATAELRRLDFRYVNVPDLARAAERARAGGQVEFLRLPAGGWIVPRWSIRHPVVRAVSRERPSVIPGVRRDAPGSEVELAEIRVTGGEVSAVRRGASTIWERGRVAFRVQVLDADDAHALPGSVVTLDEPRDTVVAGADGVALFSRVLAGPHRLGLHTATARLLGLPPVELEVAVPDAQDEPHRVVAPSERSLLARACGERAAARHESMVRGNVRGTVMPVPDARVVASWQATFTRLGGGAPVLVSRRLEATTDRRGEFVMCGLPRGVPIAMTIAGGSQRTAQTSIVIPPTAVVVEHRITAEP